VAVGDRSVAKSIGGGQSERSGTEGSWSETKANGQSRESRWVPGTGNRSVQSVAKSIGGGTRAAGGRSAAKAMVDPRRVDIPVHLLSFAHEWNEGNDFLGRVGGDGCGGCVSNIRLKPNPLWSVRAFLKSSCGFSRRGGAQRGSAIFFYANGSEWQRMAANGSEWQRMAANGRACDRMEM
jgi:hypothetical protein